MRRLLLGLMLALAICPQVFAADLSDDDYVGKFFGTTALFTVQKQLANPETEWWGDKLPAQLMNGAAYLAGLVNAKRMDSNYKPLLNPQDALVIVGWEEKIEGGYQYTIDFAGLRPSEVQMVVDNMGGVEKIIPGAMLSFRPLNRTSYYLSAGLSEPIKLAVAGEELSFDTAMPIETIHAKLSGILKGKFGESVVFDLYRALYINRDSSGQDITLYIEIPTELVPPYTGPMGE